MKAYVAGPLFTPHERRRLEEIADVVRDAGHDPILPFTPGKPFPEEDVTREEAYRRCVDGLRSADAVIAVLDGADADSGTSFEIGFAHARNLPVLGIRTDYRTLGPEGPVNLMLERGCTRLSRHPNDLEAVRADIRAFLEEPPKPRRGASLVRDKVPSLHRAEGRGGSFRKVEGLEYVRFLQRRIVEDAESILGADEQMEEKERVVDLLEAVETLISYRAYAKDSLRRIKEKNLETKGSLRIGYVHESDA